MGLPAAYIENAKREKEGVGKIKKIQVKNPTNWYTAYTDFYVSSGNILYMINIAGYDSAVKGTASTLLKGGDINIDNVVYCFFGGQMIKQKTGKYTNVLLVHRNFIEGDGLQNCFLLKDNESLEDKVYDICKEQYSIPTLREWMPVLCEKFRENNYLEELDVFSANPKYAKRAFLLRLTEVNLQNIVTTLVSENILTIPGSSHNDAELDGIETLDDYLLKFGKDLANKVIDKNKPLFTPGKDPCPEYIKKLLRKPIGIQNAAIAAATKKLEKDSSVIINGEMGTGKTLMGAAIPYVLEKEKAARVLIMCPGHLVRKWAREVRKTIPGARAFIIRRISDLFHIKKKPLGMEYYILGKDRAKLGYRLIPGVVYKNGSMDPAYCPKCGEALMKGNEVLTFDNPKKSNYKCPHCGEILWQADNKGVRRYPPAKYIAKRMKGYFDFLIADEVHELKGETAQGTSFGQLSTSCRKTIALTGTLAGGYSSNLFYILYRMFPKKLSQNFKYNEIRDFIEQYGFVEKQFENIDSDSELNTSSFGIKGRLLNTRELPGISPMLFPHFLMDSCIYASLADLQIALPDYHEEVKIVEMEGQQLEAYKEMQDTLSEAVRQNLRRGNRSLLSSYLINLLSYPDRPFDNEPIRDPESGGILYIPQELSKETIYPKERELVNLIKSEIDEDRKVFVYVQYTNRRDITRRLQKILGDHGIVAAVLLSNTVKQEKREEWIQDKVQQGVDVIIANPELVKTGLDLIDFPTIIFYQCGYSLYTLMQAARRSWRIGQDQDVRVYFMAYRNTMQERALQLMGKKYEASMVVNGKFSLDGLAQMAGDDSMIVALAKALTGKLNVKDSAENIWARLYKPITHISQVQNHKKQNVQYGQMNILDMLKEANITTVSSTSNKKSKKLPIRGQLCLDLDSMMGAS